ncbi:MAG: histidine phosphatase family protein, partial [Candidatus Kariarchaeaceae archaeon]
MLIHFIRHAQSQANADRIIAGHTDSPLSKLGIEQARHLQGSLPFYDAVYCSPLIRARETAKIALGVDKTDQLILVDQLKERYWGTLEGVSIQELLAKRDQITDPKIIAQHMRENGVESDELFMKRATEGFNHILQDASSKNYQSILIFTHKGYFQKVCEYLGFGDVSFENAEQVSISNK